MAEKTIAQQVIDIIVDRLGVNVEQVTPRAGFVADLGADSLDEIELVLELEETFGLELSDEEAEKIKTVQDAINCVTSHLPAGTAKAS
jgi:acyl carrier protein